ncbi:putative cyclin [Helianthus annuus]|nr:putative cyclin [Helianthus annuus]
MAGYMVQVQKYITEGMRTIIIEWLFEVAEDRRFFQETLFCTVTYIDKYLSVRILPRQDLFQHLAVSSMLIATYKTQPASLEYFRGKSLYTYTVEEAVEMQSDVSIVIKDEMRNHTIILFLRYE